MGILTEKYLLSKSINKFILDFNDVERKKIITFIFLKCCHDAVKKRLFIFGSIEVTITEAGKDVERSSITTVNI